MDVPFSIIVDAKLVSATADTAQASFFLSRPPLFFLEDKPNASDGRSTPKWVRCADWTEGLQASAVLRHDVTGPSSALAYLWQSICAYRSGPQSAHFISPSPTSGSPSLPTPPTAFIQGRDRRTPLDYLNVPLLHSHDTPYLRPYNTTVQDIRPIDATHARFPPEFGLSMPKPQISPTISSPTFSDVSGSVGDSPQMSYPTSSLESSQEFRRGSIPPMLMHRSFSQASISQNQDQNQFSARQPKMEAQDDTLSNYPSLEGPGSGAAFWPSG